MARPHVQVVKGQGSWARVKVQITLRTKMVAEVGDEKKVAGVHRTVSTRLLGLSPLQWHGVLAVLVIAASVLTQGLRKGVEVF